MSIRTCLVTTCALFAALQLMAVPGGDGARALGSSPSMPRPAWRLELPGHTGVHLGPAGPKVLALFADQPQRALIGVDLTTGAVAWKRAAPLPSEVSEFAADAERFYLLSASDQQVSAWTWDTGTRLWTSHAYNQRNWTTNAYALLAGGGRVVWIAYSGYLIAADGATGRKLWDRGFAYQDQWAPQTIALGNVYVHSLGDRRSDLIVLDLNTGAVVRAGSFNDAIGGPYAFDYLRWSPSSQLFYGQDGVEGAGVHGHSVRVLGPDLSQVWQREEASWCQAAGEVLVCETHARLETGPYVSHGLVAMEMATGRTLWRRPAQEDLDDAVVGGSKGTAIITHRGTLVALRPRDGRALWSLAVPVGDARVYGATLVVTLNTPGQVARVQAYRIP